MKKHLMILSAISATAVGTVANVIKPDIKENNLKTDFNVYIEYGIDQSKYDVSKGNTQTVELSNLLNLFKILNQQHKDKNVNIKTERVPRWNLVSDDRTIFGVGWLFGSVDELIDLINSDDITFENAFLTISGSEKLIKVLLDYRIANNTETQTVEVFKYQGDNIPLKQEQMESGVEFIYSHEPN